MEDHDHGQCHVTVEDWRDPASGIASLPASECGWVGHVEAVQEAGFCPVCQH